MKRVAIVLSAGLLPFAAFAAPSGAGHAPDYSYVQGDYIPTGNLHVTGNDYNLGLMNGDIGLTFSVPWDKTETGEPKATLRVAFPSSDSTGGIRWISPSRLQQLETVYAMTVHKSQGSEFNHTCLVLPDRLSPVLTKELVYTGITRARNWFSLITGDAQVFKDSVSQQVVRASGLALRLGEQ